jgi:transposase-like protein
MFRLTDGGIGEQYAIPAKSADESAVRLLLAGVEEESVTVYTDWFRAYDPLDESYQRKAVTRGEGEYINGETHVNTCESHASYATVALATPRHL